MHEKCPLWHCPLDDFYEVMKKNSINVPSIYVHAKLTRFYSKSVPSKVMKKNSINVLAFVNFFGQNFVQTAAEFLILKFITT